MNTTVYGLHDLAKVAKMVIDQMKHYSIITFYGEVGSGKTTLIKEICKQLNVKQASSSPTFSVVNEYEAPSGIIYHIDLYRMESIDEALEIGIDEYIYSGNTCFVEWPQCIEGLIFDEKVLCVEIDIPAPDQRTISIGELSVDE
jgi:tRNA threonylcarbamoyladenosine biosynthesis protein TsaE